MKRLIILLLIFIGLGAAAYFLKPDNNGPKTSMDTSDRKFAFPADQIGKFTLTKREKGEVKTFTRTSGGEWYLDGKYKVSQAIIPQMLSVFSRVSVQNIPSKAETELIHKQMKEVGLEVKIYDLNGKQVRSYTIGLESIDQSGTGFLMDGASQPYNMFMKGFDGFLRSRLTQSRDNYRDRELFQYKPEEIKTIGVKYHKDQKNSFKMTIDGDKINVTPLSQFIDPSPKPISLPRANAYLDVFTRIYGEDFDNENVRKDSIRTLIPWATVAVEDKTGDVNEIDFYPFRDLLLKNANTKDLEENSKIERFFANKRTKDRVDFIVAQNRNLKKLFRGYDYFLEE